MMQFFTKLTKPMLGFALLALASLGANAQVATNYSFSQSNSVYGQVNGTALGVSATITPIDDQYFVDPAAPVGGFIATGVGFPIGFSFNYNGFTYDRFAINANGWIGLGTTAGGVDISNTGSNYTPISSTSAPAVPNFRNRIAGLAFDMQADTAQAASIVYRTQGVAPNRVLVVQWKNYRAYNQAGSNYNFQIRLNESGAVEIRYGACTAILTRTPQVGLGGITNADFNSRTGTDWAASAAATVNTASMTLTPTSVPASGLTYAWAPAACQGIASLPATAVTNTAATANWNASGTAVSYNLQYRVIGSATWIPFAGNPVTATTANLTGLTPLTSYEYQVQGNCAGGLVSPFSSSANFGTLCAANSCTINFSMTDTFGDGWNNNEISVIQNGVVQGFATLTDPTFSGAVFSGTASITVCDAAPVQLVWTRIGSFTNEIGFVATDATGAVLYTLVATSPQPAAVLNNVLYSGTTTCPNCPVATTLVATAVTAATANLGWTAPGSATSASIEYGAAGFTPGTGTVVAATTNPQGITGLSPQTSYDFYVRITCGAQTANASAVGSFTTPCVLQPGEEPSNAIQVAAIPYSNTGNMAPCYSNTAGSPRTGVDLYYQFMPSACANNVTVSLCAGTGFDTFLYIYNAVTNLMVASNDDGCSPASTLSFAPTAGVSYYAIIEAYSTFTTVGAYSIDITQTLGAPVASVLTTSVTNAPCTGGSNGSVSVAGTLMPAAYLWNDVAASTTAVVSNLPVGTYTVTVTNSCGATSTASITLVASSFTSAVTSTADAACNADATGAVNITTTGAGVAPMYMWSNGAMTEDLTAVAAGVYDVTITSTNGCTATLSATVGEPTAIDNLVLATSPLCSNSANGMLDLMVSGGTLPYTFMWSNGAMTEDLMALAAATYTVMVTDANGCMATTTTVLAPQSFIEALASSAAISCFGGVSPTVTISPAGGVTPYTYLWSDGNMTDTQSGLLPGIYTATITDANMCTTSTTLSVTQPAAALSLMNTTTNVLCNGDATGSIVTMAMGGTAPYTYMPTTLTGLTAGAYTVMVTDGNGCTTSMMETVTQPMMLMAMASNVANNTTCVGAPNGVGMASPTGGTAPYMYMWSNGANSATNTGLAAGVYTVTITDANLCSTSATLAISSPFTFVATVASTNVSCFGAMNGTVSANLTGGTPTYTYAWSNGGNTATIANLMPGTYTAVVTDNGGCAATISAIITEPTAILNTLNASNVACFGTNSGSIMAMTTGGTAPYTYSWSNDASITIANNPNVFAGDYYVQVSDATGCSINASVTVSQAASGITVVPTTTNQTAPNNGAIALSIQGGTAPYMVVWSNAAMTQNLTGINAGTYTATVTDANGCTQTASSVVGFIIETQSLANFSTVTLYPNPTAGPFVLNVQLATAQTVTIDIFAVTGQAIATQTTSNVTNQKFDFDLSEMPSGVYFARIKAGDETKIVKISAITK